MFILSEDFWKVKKTPHKGRGVFAQKTIEAGTVIADYLGILIRPDEDNEAGPIYAMYYNEKATILPPDTSAIGAHVINHSCMPTCDTFPYKGHTLIFAVRKIFPGEELTYQYTIDPPETINGTTEMHPCRCESILCHGTMNTTVAISKKVEEFIKNTENSKYLETVPVPFGAELPKLKTYPASIPDHEIYDIFGSSIIPPLDSSEKKLPSYSEIRKIIRETGRMLCFTYLNMTILGIMDGLLIVKKYE